MIQSICAAPVEHRDPLRFASNHQQIELTAMKTLPGVVGQTR
jgi:hypothetical protein